MGLSPFRGFWDMQSQMNRMFNEMLGNVGQSPARQLEGVSEWAPAVDATTKDGNLVIRAELPGVKPEDVDISLHENVLTISGERKGRAGGGARWLLHKGAPLRLFQPQL
jgi:HSP20 family protein